MPTAERYGPSETLEARMSELQYSLRSLMRTLAPRDPFIYGVVAAIMLGASGLGAWLPARRAARINPADVLRAS